MKNENIKEMIADLDKVIEQRKNEETLTEITINSTVFNVEPLENLIKARDNLVSLTK